MTHLVGKGEHAVESVLVVEQHIGVRLGRAARICAAALADVLVYVYPAVAEALPEDVGIVLTQNGKSVEYGGLCLLEAYLLGGVGDDGGIHVVHMQLVHAQHFLAQGNVAVHLVKIRVDRLDEVGVDLDGDLGPVKGGLDGAAVAACVGEEAQLLELCVQCGGYGILVLAYAAVVGLEGVPAQDSVAALLKGDEGAVGELVLHALAVLDVGEFEFGVAEGAADVVGAVCHLARGGK